MQSGMVVHACNLSTQETEAGRSWVGGWEASLGYIVQPCLKKKKKERKKVGKGGRGGMEGGKEKEEKKKRKRERKEGMKQRKRRKEEREGGREEEKKEERERKKGRKKEGRKEGRGLYNTCFRALGTVAVHAMKYLINEGVPHLIFKKEI
jgi:hypothetical protein